MSAYFLEHHQRFKCDANNIEASLIMLREFTFIELGIDDYPAKTTVQSRYQQGHDYSAVVIDAWYQ